MALSARRVASISKAGRYLDANGLYLQVMPSGVKSWILRYSRSGRERWLGLGPLHVVGLAEARQRAQRARLQLLDGIDPIEARNADKAAQALAAARSLTFEQAANQYFVQHESRWRNAKHRAQFLSTLKAYAFDHIGKMSVADIQTGDVLRCLEPIWGSKTETASRVRSRIAGVLDWCIVRGYRTGPNPAEWKSHLSNVLPPPGQIQKTKHHAAMPFAELPAFLRELREREGVAARALEFAVLTAARTGEIVGALWNEIDLDTKTWTIPPERMKAQRPHRIPLSDRAVAILESLPAERGNDHVFLGALRGRGLSNMAMLMLLKDMRPELTTHGFRSSFKDWCSEMTAYPNIVSEAALAHVVADKVEAAYRRGDLFAKRRRMMSDWTKFCAGDAPGADVVPIRA